MVNDFFGVKMLLGNKSSNNFIINRLSDDIDLSPRRIVATKHKFPDFLSSVEIEFE